MRAFIWLLVIFPLLFCSCEKQPEGNRTASSASDETGTAQPIASVASEAYTLEITPKTASRDSTVSLIPIGFVVQDAKIEWLLNGGPVDSPLPNQLTLSQARKGDTLQAKAHIRGQEILSNKIDISNAQPEITTIKLLTEVIKLGDSLAVAVRGSDVDDDKVTFQYEWTINGEPAGTGEKIEGPVKRGDSVAVKVTPYDGESYGNAIVLTREIQNMPPIIQEHGDFQFDGTLYVYQVKASDPDGDSLTYTVESPVEGMTLDKSSGLLNWIVPSEFKGKKNVSVVVSDGNGGTVRYALVVNIQ